MSEEKKGRQPHNSAGLTSAQLSAIDQILEGRHYKDIAEDVGVHINTLTKWRCNKNFSAELNKKRKQATKEAQAVMTSNASYAAQRIIEMINDKEVSRTQLTAAIKVYDSAVGSTIAEFEERLEVLEETITRQV